MEEKKKTSTEIADVERITVFLKRLKTFRKESPLICGNRNLQFYARLMRNLARGRSGQAPEDIPVYQLSLI